MKVEQVLAWWLITIVVVGAFFALDTNLVGNSFTTT